MLDIKVFGDKTNYDAPHQKLIVFDGLVAIEGSVNMSLNAWKKAADYKENIRFVTEMDEVRRINNDYFSRLYRRKKVECLNSDGTVSSFPF